jgi:hypothetical protein
MTARSIAAATVIAAALCVCAAGAASAEFTVVEKEIAQDGVALDIRCGERVTETFELPQRATNIKVLSPTAGDTITDGFGDAPLATVESVLLRDSATPPAVDVTVLGGFEACGYPGAWRTNGIDFRASYERILHPKVLLSEEPGGLDARQEPKAITATYDAGWKSLRWRGWGENKAVAKGKFYGVRAVANNNGIASLKTFTYPVRVKLSKIRLCNGRYFYTRLKTTFVGSVHPEIRRQAKVAGVADCLNGG